jgi:hypothetical protein
MLGVTDSTSVHLLENIYYHQGVGAHGRNQSQGVSNTNPSQRKCEVHLCELGPPSDPR